MTDKDLARMQLLARSFVVDDFARLETVMKAFIAFRDGGHSTSGRTTLLGALNKFLTPYIVGALNEGWRP